MSPRPLLPLVVPSEGTYDQTLEPQEIIQDFLDWLLASLRKLFGEGDEWDPDEPEPDPITQENGITGIEEHVKIMAINYGYRGNDFNPRIEWQRRFRWVCENASNGVLNVSNAYPYWYDEDPSRRKPIGDMGEQHPAFSMPALRSSYRYPENLSICGHFTGNEGRDHWLGMSPDRSSEIVAEFIATYRGNRRRELGERGEKRAYYQVDDPANTNIMTEYMVDLVYGENHTTVIDASSVEVMQWNRATREWDHVHEVGDGDDDFGVGDGDDEPNMANVHPLQAIVLTFLPSRVVYLGGQDYRVDFEGMGQYRFLNNTDLALYVTNMVYHTINADGSPPTEHREGSTSLPPNSNTLHPRDAAYYHQKSRLVVARNPREAVREARIKTRLGVTYLDIAKTERGESHEITYDFTAEGMIEKEHRVFPATSSAYEIIFPAGSADLAQVDEYGNEKVVGGVSYPAM